MPIQILGLRDNPRNPQRKRTVFFKNNWRVDSVNEIFEKISYIIEKIPPAERHNMYFTVADCFEEDGRKLKEQHVIPFDIDALAGDTTENVRHQAIEAAKAACAAIGVNYAQTGVIFSGNGVQFFVQIPKPILADDYFDTMRPHYKVVCDIIQSKLVENGISGKVDTSVFSGGRLMRLPNTENRKPNKPTRIAEILNGTMVPQDFFLDQLSGIQEIEKPDQIKPDVIKRYPEPDAKTVMAECEFIKHCFEKPTEVLEPQWYAAASVVVRLFKDQDKSKELFHKMSEGHPSYNYYEADLKANQALENSGPRTCTNIDTLWDGCKKCVHYGSRMLSPILLHGPDYIKTKDTGFREVRQDKQGNDIPGRPAFDDLEKQFASEFEFINVLGTRTMYIMDTTHWRVLESAECMAWAKQKIVPSPSAQEMKEFLSRITLINLRKEEWVNASTDGYMNFTNGILRLETGEMQPHSSNFGFMHVIPYPYDPRSVCPKFDKFMWEISDGDEALVSVLNEFAGYSMAGGPCLAQKALLLIGEGANGKSLWADTLAKVVGDQNYSSVFVQDFKNEQMRAQLRHKLFNCSDESSGSLKDSNEFKTIVGGGNIPAKEVFKPTFNFRNTAKIILLTNNLPNTTDTSDGFFRRCLVVPFTRKFKGSEDNKNLRYELWEELSGICNRFVEGYNRLRHQKFTFTSAVAIDKAVDTYKDQINYTSRFADEEIEITHNHDDQVIYPEVYAKYQTWCMATGQKPSPDNIFFKDLRRSGKIKDDNFIRAKVDGRKYGVIKCAKLAQEF